MPKSISLLSSLLTVLVSAAVPAAWAAGPAPDAIDARIEAASGRFSGVLGASGAEAPARWFSHGDAGSNVASGPDVAYPLASVTKLFTSTAVLRLVEQGKIDLDAPAANYWPDLIGRPAAVVTIRQLLAHQSGVPSVLHTGQGLDGALDRSKWSQPTSIDEQLEPALALPLRFEPGSKYEYSNSGYLILGRIIEEVTGKTYDQVIIDLTLAPLGLADQACFCADVPGIDDATPMEWGAQGPLPAVTVHPTLSSSAGGLRITARALMAWLHALVDGQLLRRETLEAAWAPGRPTRTVGETMGLGWLVRDYEGRRVVLHDGTLPGSVAAVAIEPGTRSVAAGVLSPTLELDVVARSENYLRERVTRLLTDERPSGIPRAGQADPARLTGEYALADGRTILVTHEHGRWFVEVQGGGSPLELKYSIRMEGSFANDVLQAARSFADGQQAGLVPFLSPGLKSELPDGALDGLWTSWQEQFGALTDVHVFATNEAQTAATVRYTFQRGVADLRLVYGPEGVQGLGLPGATPSGLPSRIEAFTTVDEGLWIDGYRHDMEPVTLTPHAAADGRAGLVIGTTYVESAFLPRTR